MARHRTFVPILIAVWLIFVISIGATWLLSTETVRRSTPETVTAVRPISVWDGNGDTAASEAYPPYAYDDADEIPPPAPVLNDYPPPAADVPPAAPHRFPLLIFLLWEAVFFLFAVAYIAASFSHKLRFLSKQHPTLGNFTNLKYTPLRLISVGDGMALLFAHNLMLAFFYAYYLHRP